jgi:hypothetical protein
MHGDVGHALLMRAGRPRLPGDLPSGDQELADRIDVGEGNWMLALGVHDHWSWGREGKNDPAGSTGGVTSDPRGVGESRCEFGANDGPIYGPLEIARDPGSIYDLISLFLAARSPELTESAGSRRDS